MSPLQKDLRIVTKWITFDSLAYIRESRRQPDFPERKESWSPQDVIPPALDKCCGAQHLQIKYREFFSLFV